MFGRAVPYSERAPTREDADPRGNILYWDNRSKCWFGCIWNGYRSETANDHGVTHWMKPPPMPLMPDDL